MPSPRPTTCDCVYASIYSAAKTGKAANATAVIYWSRSRYVPPPLMVLDWDLVRIQGQFIEVWLPQVFARLEALTVEVGAQLGGLGAYIENKGAGSVLLRIAEKNELPLMEINEKLAGVDKDERVLSASSYIQRDMVKFSNEAAEKTVDYNGVNVNHLMNQITGFAPGAKDIDDELLNAFTYGVALGLGAEEGL